MHQGFKREGPDGNPAGNSREEGFTMIEMAITVLILGIILSLSALAYSSISRGAAINGAKRQVEAAIERAKTSARQENVQYQIVFYSSSDGTNPNTYEFYHDVKDGTGAWAMQPVDKSVSGESVAESSGHWYIKVSNGVNIGGGNTTISFTPSGTVMNITIGTIDLESGGKTANVSVDEEGKITVN